MIGTVKFYDPKKAFGFITTEAADFFFHVTSILGDAPIAGAPVEFWLDDDPRGGDRLAAVEVQVRRCLK